MAVDLAPAACCLARWVAIFVASYRHGRSSRKVVRERGSRRLSLPFSIRGRGCRAEQSVDEDERDDVEV